MPGRVQTSIGMAARTVKIRHDEETRAKIQAANIIHRLQQCIMGEITLDAQQVSCAKALLNKVLPDLTYVEQNVETRTYVAELPAVAPDTSQWLKQSLPNPRLQ